MVLHTKFDENKLCESFLKNFLKRETHFILNFQGMSEGKVLVLNKICDNMYVYYRGLLLSNIYFS